MGTAADSNDWSSVTNGLILATLLLLGVWFW